MRLAVVEALGQIGGEEAREALLYLAEAGEDDDPRSGRQAPSKSSRPPKATRWTSELTDVQSDQFGDRVRDAGGVPPRARISSQKWQAVKWFGSTSISGGSFSRHSSWANGQRGWKRQPVGGLTGLGTSPVRIMRWRLRSIAGSGIGTAESSALVYGCSGRS